VTTKLYPRDLNPAALEPHLSQHKLALTAEGLDGKADIAEQLAWRDQRLEAAKKRERELVESEAKMAELHKLYADCVRRGEPGGPMIILPHLEKARERFERALQAMRDSLKESR
jgi:hypothetical protein